MTFLKKLILSIILFSSLTACAQLKFSSFEYGLAAGTFIYQGDLVTSRFGSFRQAQPMISVMVAKPLSSSLTARLNFSSGRMLADEGLYDYPDWKQHRNFAFATPAKELSLDLAWNVRRNTGYFGSRLSPYVFAGVAATFLKVGRDWSRLHTEVFPADSDVAKGLAIDSVNKPPSLIPAIPLGAGLRYFISPQLSVFGEGGYRFTKTDYLDGFRYAANNRRNDSYYGIRVGLIYNFFSDKYKCPPVN